MTTGIIRGTSLTTSTHNRLKDKSDLSSSYVVMPQMRTDQRVSGLYFTNFFKARADSLERFQETSSEQIQSCKRSVHYLVFTSLGEIHHAVIW